MLLIGISPVEQKTNIIVEGMTCSNCALGVARMLEKKGLQNVSVDFTTGDVSFSTIEPEKLPEIEAGIRSLGYSVAGSSNKSLQEVKSGRFPSTRQEQYLLVCTILSLPLMGHMLMSWSILHNPWFQLACCTPVFILGMIHFGKSAWNSIKSGVPNMDVLITVGSTSAFFYSLTGMYLYLDTPESHRFLFFETTSTIITLILLGNVIEARSVKKTTSALRELAQMQPSEAEKITIGKNMVELVETIPASDLKPGDMVMLKTGSSIPADGEIYWGELLVDESAMTGESLPTTKATGSQVLTGTTVTHGSAKFVVRKSGASTMLAAIIDMVKRAQQSKPEIQKLGDKVSAWFVPVVILISVLAFFLNLWGLERSIGESLMNAVAVLVISCPCAMGLATPTAVAVGLGIAARKGILVKGGSTLEKFHGIKTVVFDKTGTLTTGKFRVAELKLQEMEELEAIEIMYGIEQHSSHPIAQSLVENWKPIVKHQVLFNKVEEIKGIGMIAEDTEGNSYQIKSGRNEGFDLVLEKNGENRAYLKLMDDIRPGAKDLVDWLQSNGIKCILSSGDRFENCKRVAESLGIAEYYHSQTPVMKSEMIHQLRDSGKVLMLGDGINDAPSLESADIGVSFGEASTIALNTADVVLIRQADLNILKDAIRIGKLTLTTIKQNLFWAFAYNAVAIPMAAIGMLSPMLAALSMAFSDVVVIGNSFRLRFRLK